MGNVPTNCSSVFDHFVKLALKEIINLSTMRNTGMRGLVVSALRSETIGPRFEYGHSLYVEVRSQQ